MEYKLTRRESLQRFTLLASSSALLGCVYPDAPTEVVDLPLDWPQLEIPEIVASGYGTDPDLLATSQDTNLPWPKTLTKSHLQTLNHLGEFLCPGAQQAGVADVVDEWVSAPYPDQQADRQLLLPGLLWLDQYCVQQYGKRVVQLENPELENLVTTLDATQLPQMATPKIFFNRLRTIIAGAYFSSPQGAAELGYVGNTPIAGDYPGPSDDALAHLDQLLAELGLQL